MRHLMHCVLAAIAVVLASGGPLAGQFASGEALAAEIVPELDRSASIVVVPTVNNEVDWSGRLSPLANDLAASIRTRGITIRTLSDPPLQSIARQSFGARGPLTRTSIGSFGRAAGVGTLLLLALADVEESRTSITASIHSILDGVAREVWRSQTPWRFQGGTLTGPGQYVRACTGNLLVNGNFERHWSTGWSRSYGDIEQGASVTEVVRGADGHVLHLSHQGRSHVTIHQTVPVPLGRIVFQYEGKFTAREGGMIGFSGTGNAGLSLTLSDANHRALGQLYAGSYINIWEGSAFAGAPEAPQSTNRFNFSRLPNGETLRERVDVTRLVMDRMGQVDLNQVAFVTVAVSVGANDRRASAEAWVDKLSVEVCPR